MKPTVFWGDSLTAWHDWGRSFPGLGAVNLGVSGDTCAGLRSRLAEVLDLDPARLFLQVGVNDLLRGAAPGEIVEGHRRLWDELGALAPGLRLYVVSLLPCQEAPDLPARLEIMAINRELAAEAGRRRLVFVDVFSALADENGNLRPEYTSDGLHLTPRAYQAWVQVLRPCLEEMDAS